LKPWEASETRPDRMIPKRFTPRYKLLLSFVSALWVCTLGPTAFAQGNPLSLDPPAFLDPPTPAEPVEETAETAEPALIVESPQPAPDPVSKRLFGVIPNYRADQTLENYTPLRTSEKFHIARSDSFDWPNFFLLAGYAIQSQVASGGFSHNGGFPGFAKFYARGLGDQIIGSYVTEAILPSLLHEDPRFFRLGSGTFWHRASYAASRIFVTRTDSGGTRFNISEIAGNAGFVAATSFYYPDSRSAAESAERYGMQLGNDAVSNLLTEFWPDIKHHLRFRRPYLFPFLKKN
jgi:hypothetical protein